MPEIKYLLFDAANTLIHKPDLWVKLMGVFENHRIAVQEADLKVHHKMVSECISFPDQTSKDFYNVFNKELLLSLGIVPTQELLDDIFSACTYLPWQAFEDTKWLKDYAIPMGVLSNFNSTLTKNLDNLFGKVFSNIFISEEIKARKPHPAFFAHAIEEIGLATHEILYIGDSFKLDILPGLDAGLNSLLIDRIGTYPGCKYRISNFSEINNYIAK